MARFTRTTTAGSRTWIKPFAPSSPIPDERCDAFCAARARARRPAGRGPAPRGGGERNRSRGPTLRRPGPRPRLDRHPGDRGRDLEEVRLQAALGRPGQRPNLRLAARARCSHRGAPRPVNTACGALLAWRALGAALFVAYPATAHFAPPAAAVALLAALVAYVVSSFLIQNPWRWAVPPLAAAIAFVTLPDAPALLYVPPVAVNLGLCWVFGRTLARGRVPLIARFAMLEQ